jgi:hypothetical protein
MHFKPGIAITSAALALALSLSGAQAADKAKAPNVVKPSSPYSFSIAPVFDALRTADGLVRWGDANNDAMALITAAKIMNTVGFSELVVERMTLGRSVSEKPPENNRSVEAVLQRARKLAAGRQDLLALADDVAKSSVRGMLTGPKARTFVLDANATDQIKMQFVGGLPAQVQVSGNGASDLNMVIYDQFRNPICKDEAYGDQMFCLWTPRRTGLFIIEVKNGALANEYILRTN